MEKENIRFYIFMRFKLGKDAKSIHEDFVSVLRRPHLRIVQLQDGSSFSKTEKTISKMNPVLDVQLPRKPRRISSS